MLSVVGPYVRTVSTAVAWNSAFGACVHFSDCHVMFTQGKVSFGACDSDKIPIPFWRERPSTNLVNID